MENILNLAEAVYLFETIARFENFPDLDLVRELEEYIVTLYKVNNSN